MSAAGFGKAGSVFRDRTALISGGASGIGQALGVRLVELGAHVTLADLDGGAAEAADGLRRATRGNGTVSGIELDVRDRAGYADAIAEICDRYGRIDFVFNNAGISLGGPTQHVPGEHWDRIIDINLGGVINGVLAAYPKMIEQGSGHIINTASAAGLIAAPFAASYSTTKFAIVGLSAALRPEAAAYGVRVTALCPGMVETPILDKAPPADLPPRTGTALSGRTYLETAGMKPISASRLARRALSAIARNKAVVIIPGNVRIGWYLGRLSSRAMEAFSRRTVRLVQAELDERSG